MNKAKPKRRWFRFSLRTLFVIVTVLGGLLAYQLNWIRQRHEIIAFYETSVAPKTGYAWPLDVVSYAATEEFPPYRTAPWNLRLFGERGYAELGLFRHVSDSELLRIKGLFPEAEVIRTDEEP